MTDTIMIARIIDRADFSKVLNERAFVGQKAMCDWIDTETAYWKNRFEEAGETMIDLACETGPLHLDRTEDARRPIEYDLATD